MVGKDRFEGQVESLDSIILDTAFVLLPELGSEDAAIKAAAVEKQGRITAALAGFDLHYFSTPDGLFDEIRMNRMSLESFLVVADLTREGRNNAVVVREDSWNTYRLIRTEFPNRAYLALVGDVDAITSERNRDVVKKSLVSESHMIVTSEYDLIKDSVVNRLGLCLSIGKFEAADRTDDEVTKARRLSSAPAGLPADSPPAGSPDFTPTAPIDIPPEVRSGRSGSASGKYSMRAFICGFADDAENFMQEIPVLLKGIDGCIVYYTDMDIGKLLKDSRFRDYFVKFALDSDGFDRILLGVKVRDDKNSVSEVIDLAGLVGVVNMTVAADGKVGLVYDAEAYAKDIAFLHENGLLVQLATYAADGSSDEMRSLDLMNQARVAVVEMLHNEAQRRMEAAHDGGEPLLPSDFREFRFPESLYLKDPAPSPVAVVVEDDSPTGVVPAPNRPPLPKPARQPAAQDVASSGGEVDFDEVMKQTRRKAEIMRDIADVFSEENGVLESQKESYVELAVRYTSAEEAELRKAVASVVAGFELTTEQQDRYFELVDALADYHSDAPNANDVSALLRSDIPNIIKEDGSDYRQIHDLLRIALRNYTKGGADLLYEGKVLWESCKGKPYQEDVARMLTAIAAMPERSGVSGISSAAVTVFTVLSKADTLDDADKVAYIHDIFAECDSNNLWVDVDSVVSVAELFCVSYAEQKSIKEAAAKAAAEEEKAAAEAKSAALAEAAARAEAAAKAAASDDSGRYDQLSAFDSPPAGFAGSPSADESVPGSLPAAEAQSVKDHVQMVEEDGGDDDTPKAEEPVDDLGGKEMAEDEKKGTEAPEEAPVVPVVPAAPALEVRVEEAEPADAAPAPAAAKQDYDLTEQKPVTAGAAAVHKPSRSRLYRNLFLGTLGTIVAATGIYFVADYLGSRGPGGSLDEIADSRAAPVRSKNSNVPAGDADALQKMYHVQSYRTSDSEADMDGYTKHMALANEALDFGLDFDPNMPVSDLEAEVRKTRKLYERFEEKMMKKMVGSAPFESSSPALALPHLFSGNFSPFGGYYLAPEDEAPVAEESTPAVGEPAPAVSAPAPEPSVSASSDATPAPGNYVPHHRSAASRAALGHKVHNPHTTPAHLLGPGSYGHGHR